MVKLVYTTDSKSVGSNAVRVQVPPRPPEQKDSPEGCFLFCARRGAEPEDGSRFVGGVILTNHSFYAKIYISRVNDATFFAVAAFGKHER